MTVITTPSEPPDRLRSVVVWAAVAVVLSVTVAVLAIVLATKVVGDAQSENLALRTEVGTNTQRAECRTRITTLADVIGNERQTAQSRFVIATARYQAAQTAGNQEEMTNQRQQATAAVADIERFNSELEIATDLQQHQVEICTDNPAFTPPSEGGLK